MKVSLFHPVIVGIAMTWIVAVLLDSGTKTGVLLLLAWFVVSFLRKSSAAARHAVWTAAMLCALAMPILSFSLPQWRVLPSWLSQPSAGSEMPRNSVIPPLHAPPMEDQVRTPEDESGALAIEPSVHQPTNVVPESPVRITPVSHAGPAISLAAAVVITWALGACGLLLALLRSAWSLHRLFRRSPTIRDGTLVEAFNEAAHELQLSRGVTLIEGPADAMPMVWGIWRARLLLPSAAKRWSAARLRAVMLHELAHIHRWDPLTLVLAQLARAVHWFNPLAWAALHKLQSEQERACDDYVLRAGVRPSDYANDVLEITTSLHSAPASEALALSMASPARLEGRLRMIVAAASNRRALSLGVVAVTSIFALLVALPLAMLRATDDRIEANRNQSEIASSAKESGFGPVVDAALSEGNGMEEEFLDLDTGRRLTRSAVVAGSLRDWARAEKMDLMLNGKDAAGAPPLRTFDLWLSPGANGSFESATADELRDKVAQPRSTIAPSLPGDDFTYLNPEAEKTDTYRFETREGARGVLQFVSAIDNGGRAKIRYKLLEPPAAANPETPVSGQAYVFDRQYEREMRSSDRRYLDLDNGAFVETHPPGELVGTMGESDLRVRSGMNMVAVAAVADEKWNTATPDDVLKAVNRAAPQKQIRLGGPESTVGKESRRTWFFQTAEGNSGILQVLPHESRPDSVFVRFKLVRPRYEFQRNLIILSSDGGSPFLDLDTARTSSVAPENGPVAYLAYDPKDGWSLRVENAYNYHTERAEGVKLWESRTAEEAAVPAGLAGAPPELKGYYSLRQKDLPAVILIPQYGLLRVAEFDSRTHSVILDYKRVITPRIAEANPVSPASATRRSAATTRARASEHELDGLGIRERQQALDLELRRELLRQAELEFTRITELHSQKLVSTEAFTAAKSLVELRRAESAGDPLAVARVRLKEAQSNLERIVRLHAAKQISQVELERAQGNLALRRIEMQQAQLAAPTAANTARTTATNVVLNPAAPSQQLSAVAAHPSLGAARSVVNDWLGHVGAERTDEMWALTTRESGMDTNIRKLSAFPSIRARHALGSDSAAMVVSTRFNDDSARPRALLFVLVKRDDRWLIRELLVDTPDNIQRRVEGFAAYPGVRFDVQSEDLAGTWSSGFLVRARHLFHPDGTGETRQSKGNGPAEPFRWEVAGDILKFHRGDQTTEGRIVRMEDELFAVRFANGNQWGYHREPEPNAAKVEAPPGLQRGSGYLGLHFGPGEFRELLSVIEGSPAAAAGLKRGDYVIAINGKPSAEIHDVMSYRKALEGPAGSRVQLSVRKADSNQNVVLELERVPLPATLESP